MECAAEWMVGAEVDVEEVGESSDIEVAVVVVEVESVPVVFAALCFPKKFPVSRSNPRDSVGKGMGILGTSELGVDELGGLA